ncbi:MAG TPA: isocitrate lyase/phosphoenolpyruvate mutase family protein [Candidatus Binataceae bacterium]|nr:isocitrate lyase/phosphoenolpyruvate mutase family protein [Candidatus Binataceae bacterium]
MANQAQREKAEAFRRMHDRSRILVLPNAWDAASARIFENAGFSAVATTSAGVSYTAGYPDGEVIPPEDMLTILRWITRCVEIPVTADIESGFGTTPHEVGETVRMVIEAGAVGINLEDSIHAAGVERRLYDLPAAVERIRAARAAAEAAGVPIVINGRTDVYLMGIEKASRFDEAVRRLNAYREAGADCLYPIGYLDRETISAIVKAVDGPINVMGIPGTPSAAELESMRVARVSTASGPARVAMTATQKLASELARKGSFDVFGGDTMTHQVANALIARRDASTGR